MKNPLKPTCIFFYIASSLCIILFLVSLYFGHPLLETIKHFKVISVFLCLSAVFIISYHRRYILAWWAAMSFLPILYITWYITQGRPLDDTLLYGVIIVFLLLSSFFVSPYKSYEEFIRSGGKSVGEKKSKWLTPEEYCKTVAVQQNPLQIVFYGAIFLALSALFSTVFGRTGRLVETYGELAAYTTHAITIFMSIAFVWFYWKKNIAAWWIAVFANPVAWVVFSLFPPFILKVFLFGLIVNVGITGYLLLKYKPYKNYIQVEPQEAGNTGAVERVS
jgi:hypothetical protein